MDVLMLVRLFALSALSAVQLLAQPVAPPKRAHHSLVFDGAGRRVLLSGGSTPVDGGRTFTFFNDLWAFDGSAWTALGESGQKASGVQLAFDTRQNRIVSFGGYTGASIGDLRVLVGDSWNTVGRHPELVAAEPGFVYDSHRDRFVLFGGSAGRGATSGDTWELAGTSWTKVAVTSPPARQGHAMVFDSKRNRTVVFGGIGAAPPGEPSPPLADTWEFDGSSWTQIHVTGPARFAAGAAFDSRRGVVVLFGGLGPDGFLGDTWSWNGTTWRKLADTGPEPRAMGYLAYDPHRDRVVMFGGRKGWPDGDLNDTWEWDGSRWREIAR